MFDLIAIVEWLGEEWMLALGGMLAGGCAVDAGVSGTSVFALGGPAVPAKP